MSQQDNPSEAAGYLKVTILTVSLQQCNVFKVKASINHLERQSQIFQNLEDPNPVNTSFLFKCTPTHELTLELLKVHDDGGDIQQYGYCQFPIKSFANAPRVRHAVEVKMANAAQVNAQQKFYLTVGTIEMEILFIQNDIGTLSIRVVQGYLMPNLKSSKKIQNKQIVLQSSQHKYKTKIIKSKDAAIWDEQFNIPIHTVDQTITIRMLRDDEIVGEAIIDLFKHRCLLYSSEPKPREITLKYDGKQAGIVNLQSKFTYKITKEPTQQK